MDQAEEGARIGAALAGWLGRLTFHDQTSDEVTALLIDTVVAWARAQGWRAYRRAASVMPLPPPYEHQHSIVDVGCARADGAPVVIEVDHSGRRRSVDKLRLESEAGRIAIWLRWGERRFEPPPAPIAMVPFRVTSRPDPGGAGRRYSRLPASDRPAPAHLPRDVDLGDQVDLFPRPEGTGRSGEGPERD
ncbi:hypothetical protein ACN28C_23225 [Plantactinospora sp. WMMC1484]|uniref:hypothetical protein n=1 Tax=Plantactinospora sp. WMMC1484 TaxID=3404122 RepID=UPI003BF46FAF